MVKRTLEQLFTGLCVSRLGAALLRNAGIGPLSRSVASLRDAEIQALTAFIADFTLPVRGVKGFDSAQVTAGGIAWEEFSPDNLASRLCPGLYAAGEVLDVDGDCGGFNLMFAFASGILAGSDGYLEEVLS
jgi:predicted flavoprotein YhiN